jgi:hypothetical protein
MQSLDIPVLQMLPVALERREVRGEGDVDRPGEVCLGGPFWTLLPDDYPDEDSDTKAFRRDPGWRWILGVLALSLNTDAGTQERYDRVWLSLSLTRPDGESPPAIAWSMKPDRLSSSVTRSTKVTMGPKLTIADVGIDANVERGTERALQDVSLDALNEKTPQPQWRLCRTHSAELLGCIRLALIVRAPATAEVEARLDLGYVTSRRRCVFFWPNTPHQEPRRVTKLP